MRLASFFAVGAFLLLFASLSATNTACGFATSCGCPTSAVPQAAIALSCATAPPPALALSGVCAGTASVQGGQILFGSYSAGSCHVEVTYADGTTYSTDVEFAGQWLACGSDPHGCGELISPVGLSTPADGVLPTLIVPGSQCTDGGAPDGGAIRDSGAAPDAG